MTKVYAHDRALQEKLLAGVDKLADNVAATLGPRGRNVLLYKNGVSPVITKDGVTVANFVHLDDPVENAGAEVLKQAALQTNALAGDGTTTSTVLARDILANAQKYIIAGSSPIELKRGMDHALEKIVNEIEHQATPVSSFEEIEHVATISANNDASIGKLIATAADQAGADGAITIEEAKAEQTSLDVVEGFRFDSGYFARAFVTDEKRNIVDYDDVLMLVTDHKIENVNDIFPILELVSREAKPFVIVAEEVEGQALAALIMNAVRGTMRVAAVKAPRYGNERRDIMRDLCLATGANFVSRESGKKLGDVKLVDLGTCKRIEIMKNFTTIVDGNSDWPAIEERIESLKSEIKQTEDMEECRRLQERITRLNSGVAIIKVGAPTEVEMTEKKHRIEDALEAVRAAQEQGIVPGGGSTLLNCRKLEFELENEDQRFGAEILKRSLEAPIRQMASNAGESSDLIISRLQEQQEKEGFGWNFASGEVVDMMEAGIIDPAKVTITALRNAVSVASTLITTNNAIVEIENES
tara:strand:- start:3938 stop:5521 length:1584 start_codon:yes stop_codon:yes gene_type:complete